MWAFATAVAWAGPPEHHLIWDLTVLGKAAGTRELTVRYLDGGNGRILESFTDIDLNVGRLKAQYHQRMTAHVTFQPADFHSVSDDGGVLEVQGRWAPSAWTLVRTENGRSSTSTIPSSRLDLSTADLLDPQSPVPISRYAQATLLVAETGEVVAGTVQAHGASEITIQGRAVPVTSYTWTSPEGRSELFYSVDGFLVRFDMRLGGVAVRGTLRDVPPAGADDFPVNGIDPIVDATDL